MSRNDPYRIQAEVRAPTLNPDIAISRSVISPNIIGEYITVAVRRSNLSKANVVVVGRHPGTSINTDLHHD